MERIPFYRARSGLWLPFRDPSEEAETQERPPGVEHTLTTIGYEQVYGGDSTIGGIVERLRHFSLHQVIFLLSRITLRLGEFRSLERRAEGQGQLALKLFSHRSIERIAAALRDGAPDVDWNMKGVLFHERQTLNLLKLAFLTLPHDGEDPADGPVEPLAEALLMMNDLIDRDPTEGAVGEAASQRLELYVLANMLFNQGKTELAEIARVHELFVNPPVGKQTVADLRARLHKATGLNWEMTWFALRAFHAYFQSIKLEAVDSGSVAMSRGGGFQDFDFTSEELERMYAVAAQPASVFQEEIRQRYAFDDLRPFDVIPFARHPLVVFDDDVYCLSLPLLRDLAGMNLQYRFIDPQVFDENEREGFFQIRGEVFENYLQRLLVRTFGDRLISEQQLKEAAGDRKSCDALVVYPEAALLFEFKSATVPATVRGAESFDAYEDRVLDTVVRSAKQLSSTIDLIEGGNLQQCGITPSHVRQYIPITVMLEPIQAPLTHRRLSRLLEKEGVYGRRNILPFQIMSVDELEMVEKAVAAGANVYELIRTKVTDPDLLGITFNNFCHLTQQSWVDDHNPNLAQRFERISDDLLHYLQSRKTTDGMGADMAP